MLQGVLFQKVNSSEIWSHPQLTHIPPAIFIDRNVHPHPTFTCLPRRRLSSAGSPVLTHSHVCIFLVDAGKFLRGIPLYISLWSCPVLFLGGSQWTKHSHNHSDPVGGFLSHGGSQHHPSHYLVGGIPTPSYPSEKYEFVSWDDEIPHIWKNNPFMFQTTNQLQLTSDRFVDRKNITAITGVQAERQRLRRLQTPKWHSLLNCLVSQFITM